MGYRVEQKQRTNRHLKNPGPFGEWETIMENDENQLLVVVGEQTMNWRIEVWPEKPEKEMVILSLRALGFAIGTAKVIWRALR